MAEITRDTLIDGRYRVVSRLGTGGMAEVFLATDQQLGRQVALKLLHRRFAEDPDFVERFRREARSAAGLQHPNVVSVYDRGSFEDTNYIAMEYLPGRSLKQLIRDEAPLHPVRAIDIAIQILQAARFAHDRGIVHRDLKPHNVIVDDSGHAKVTDFGIARAGASDMTETGSIMGTAQYLSPEQAQGHAVSPASDLYSVGVVLYEMLTGRVPFDGESAVTIALKHVSEAPTPPREINPAIPLELEQTVLWTLNKDPADRPQDAEQLIRVLEHSREAIVTGAAGQHTARMAAMGDGPTHPAAGLPAQGLPDLPPAGPPGTTSDPATNGSGSDDSGADDQDERAPWWRRWSRWLWAALVVLLVAVAAAVAYFLSRPKQDVVPGVRNDQLNIARRVIQDHGFAVGVTRTGSGKPSGTVIGESPAGGTKADKGSTVTLTVSRGPGDRTVPSVQGESRGTATAQLEKAGLKVGKVTSQSSTQFPAGQATGTSPGATRSVPAGTSVTLFVSSGQPRAQVPSVTGDTASAASSALQSAGFAVSTQTQTSSSTTPGDVIRQSPSAGVTATRGSTVTIVVATAPATATVPPVTGDPASGAASALQSAGFTVIQRTRGVTDPSKVATVVSQSPSGGSTARKGSAVTIVVGRLEGGATSSTTTSKSSSSTTTSKSSTTPTTPTTPTSPTSPTSATPTAP